MTDYVKSYQTFQKENMALAKEFDVSKDGTVSHVDTMVKKIGNFEQDCLKRIEYMERALNEKIETINKIKAKQVHIENMEEKA